MEGFKKQKTEEYADISGKVSVLRVRFVILHILKKKATPPVAEMAKIVTF